jgi:hypothetical protein
MCQKQQGYSIQDFLPSLLEGRGNECTDTTGLLNKKTSTLKQMLNFGAITW